jgi:hypothetical protein
MMTDLIAFVNVHNLSSVYLNAMNIEAELCLKATFLKTNITVSKCNTIYSASVVDEIGDAMVNFRLRMAIFTPNTFIPFCTFENCITGCSPLRARHKLGFIFLARLR